MRVGMFSGAAAGEPHGRPAGARSARAPPMTGAALAAEVTTAEPYVVPAGGGASGSPSPRSTSASRR